MRFDNDPTDSPDHPDWTDDNEYVYLLEQLLAEVTRQDEQKTSDDRVIRAAHACTDYAIGWCAKRGIDPQSVGLGKPFVEEEEFLNAFQRH